MAKKNGVPDWMRSEYAQQQSNVDRSISSFEGIDATATLYSDRVEISGKRKSVLWGQGLLGEKSFHLDSIMAVQIREANPFTNGFLQFQLPGDKGDRRTGVLDAVKDENAIMFRVTKDGNDRAREFKSQVDHAVQRRNATPPPSSTQSLSIADELAKLAALRDQGIITTEEFEAQKRRVLG